LIIRQNTQLEAFSLDKSIRYLTKYLSHKYWLTRSKKAFSRNKDCCYPPELSLLQYLHVLRNAGTILLLLLIVEPELTSAVGAETSWPWVEQDLVRRCANHSEEVDQESFCGPMAEYSLEGLIERYIAAGSAIIGLLPTAVVLLAGCVKIRY
jgi:hypothetical protein